LPVPQFEAPVRLELEEEISVPLSRRGFLGLAAAGIATGISASATPARTGKTPKIKAIAFDAFPIFDPRPVFALAERLFPGKGGELSAAWRTRQFEYQWLRALSGQYADFWQVTEDSLRVAAELSKLDLTREKREKLMNAYLELGTWPDTVSAVNILRNAGIRLALLSNATPNILAKGIKHSALDNVFEHVLSTDRIKTYKPDRRAYQMAIDALRLRKEEILFVAFAGWDAAGAKSFGYTTFWANRLGAPAEQLGSPPDGVGNNLDDLVGFVKARQQHGGAQLRGLS
jgi:2-haloacid dehalogenase